MQYPQNVSLPLSITQAQEKLAEIKLNITVLLSLLSKHYMLAPHNQQPTQQQQDLKTLIQTKLKEIFLLKKQLQKFIRVLDENNCQVIPDKQISSKYDLKKLELDEETFYDKWAYLQKQLKEEAIILKGKTISSNEIFTISIIWLKTLFVSTFVIEIQQPMRMHKIIDIVFTNYSREDFQNNAGFINYNQQIISCLKKDERIPEQFVNFFPSFHPKTKIFEKITNYLRNKFIKQTYQIDLEIIVLQFLKKYQQLFDKNFICNKCQQYLLFSFNEKTLYPPSIIVFKGASFQQSFKIYHDECYKNKRSVQLAK